MDYLKYEMERINENIGKKVLNIEFDDTFYKEDNEKNYFDLITFNLKNAEFSLFYNSTSLLTEKEIKKQLRGLKGKIFGGMDIHKIDSLCFHKINPVYFLETKINKEHDNPLIMVFNKEPRIDLYTLKDEPKKRPVDVMKGKTLDFFIAEGILPEKAVMQDIYDELNYTKREIELSIELAIVDKGIKRDGKFLKRINRS